MQNQMTVALAGNPNVGKSTIFNALTGSRQHVGNWPGKTVEKKQGRLSVDGNDIVIVDLPGTYSLNAYTLEEIIARDFILEHRPDVVVAVVDAANLERNLYLVAQVLELGAPVILALNMADVAQTRGITIELDVLSERLGGLPIIKMVGSQRVGLDALKAAIAEIAAQDQPSAAAHIDYGKQIEREIAFLVDAIAHEDTLSEMYNARWLAVKLLENERDIYARLKELGLDKLIQEAERASSRIAAQTGEDSETLIADRRYAFVGQIVGHALSRRHSALETLSDKVDRIATHSILGLPLFMLLMWGVFQFTANVSAPLLEWVDGVVNGVAARWASTLFSVLGLGNTWAESFVIDGLIAGVGGVLAFIPVLVFLYMAIGVLEDSGYMARAAFVMDRVMRAMGLQGKSFLPMMVGFGCTVPAVYATRTLENRDDRRLTAFLATFMSCGARLPVYVLFGGAFFGAQAGNLTFGMYVFGIAIAFIIGFVMRRTIYRDKPHHPLILELPPYRVPNLRNVGFQTWRRTHGFIHKATTIILGASVLLWLMLAIPISEGKFGDVSPSNSLLGAASGAVAPVFAPAGFGTWQAGSALVTGFIAKETIVSTMSQVYTDTVTDEEATNTEEVFTLAQDITMIAAGFGEAVVLTLQETANIVPRTLNLLPGINVPEADWLNTNEENTDTTRLETALRDAFSPLAAIAFNLFVLLYVPCAAAVAAMRQEFGMRWSLAQAAFTFILAWSVAVVVYQGGTLLGLGV